MRSQAVTCFLIYTNTVVITIYNFFLVCVTISYIILNHRRRLPFIKAVNAFPGPRLIPLIGNTYLFVKKKF